MTTIGRVQESAVSLDPSLTIRHREPDIAVLEFGGAWASQRGLPDAAVVVGEIRSGRVRRLAFDAGKLTSWDSGLVTYVLNLLGETRTWRLAVDRAGLPEGGPMADCDG
jgi:hypothetical protein